MQDSRSSLIFQEWKVKIMTACDLRKSAETRVEREVVRKLRFLSEKGCSFILYIIIFSQR